MSSYQYRAMSTDFFFFFFQEEAGIRDVAVTGVQTCALPISKMTWDNAAYIGPAVAGRLGIASGDVVEIEVEGRKVIAPAWILPGHPDGAATVHFGYGRRKCGRVGAGIGFDAYALRTTGALWSHPGAAIRRTGGRQVLACTQEHFSMEGRDLVRVGTLLEYKDDPEFARKMGEAPPKDSQ